MSCKSGVCGSTGSVHVVLSLYVVRLSKRERTSRLVVDVAHL